MSPLLHRCLVTLVCVLLFGCQENSGQVAPPVGVVEANSSYLKYFGQPPAVRSGHGYARVVYLPLRKSPERLRALPLFLFTDDEPVRRVLTQLVDGSIVLPGEHPQFNPFPKGSTVVVREHSEGVLDVSLSLPGEVSDTLLFQCVRSLVETASQFDQVSRVIVRGDGELLPSMPAGGFSSHPEWVDDVAPPTLVMIAGMWESGAQQPEEILVNFDRPVTVDRCEVFDSDGGRIDGDYFVSTFKMSVVIHPEKAEQFKAGMVLTVDWQVTDALGRSASGQSRMSLQRFDH